MKRHLKFLFCTLFLLNGVVLWGQTDSSSIAVLERRIEILEKAHKGFPIKLSGYAQIDALFTQMGDANVWNPTFTLRRGRLRALYENSWGMTTFLIDATERGVSLKDAYLGIWIPKMKWFSFSAGLMRQPFGYEIEYSSTLREAPERVLVYRTLFTDQRDVGVQLNLSAPKELWLSRFKLEAGLFAGNAQALEDVKRYGDLNKDFIGRLCYQQILGVFSFGGCFSYYNGRVALANNRQAYEVNRFAMLAVKIPQTLLQEERSYMVSTEIYQAPAYKDAAARLVRKEYFSIGASLTIESVIGRSHLRGEYLWGRQPGLLNGSRSHSGKGYLSTTDLPSGDLYLRDFNSAYLYYVQTIGRSRHSAVFRFDFYDPNRILKGEGLQTEGDVAFYTASLGYLFNLSKNVRLMANYCFNFNERSSNIQLSARYAEEILDDILTIRAQYVF